MSPVGAVGESQGRETEITKSYEEFHGRHRQSFHIPHTHTATCLSWVRDTNPPNLRSIIILARVPSASATFSRS